MLGLILGIAAACTMAAQTFPGTQGWDGPGKNSAVLGVVFGPLTAPPWLPDAEANKAVIRRALNKWAEYVQITFADERNPDALRTLYIHFDAIPGQYRAGAAPPNDLAFEPWAGDVVFTTALPWDYLDGSGPTNIGGDFYTIALHEIGHALGLDHRTDVASIMYPWDTPGWMRTFTQADIDAIRSLYAERTPALPPDDGRCQRSGMCPSGASTLAITISAPPSSDITTVQITGMISGGTPPYAIPAWSTDIGYSGVANTSNPYSADVIVTSGANVVSIRVTDAAGNVAAASTTVTGPQRAPR